jgi:hypothetical protein
MKATQLMSPAHFFMEINEESIRIFNGAAGLELPLERLADGLLTDSCKSNLTLQLRRFIDRKSWQPQARVYCGIGARGVSLRRLSLPAAPKEELHRLLPLQIESEFPLPPEKLAWGYQILCQTQSALQSFNGKQELVVAAIKKDTLEEYSRILEECGASPVFTLAALARSYLCPQPPLSYGVLNVAPKYSELITVVGGAPTSVRLLSWGMERLLGPARGPHGNGSEEEIALPTSPGQQICFGGSAGIASPPEAANALEPLARLLNGQSVGQRLYVTGLGDPGARLDLPTQLAKRFGNGIECQVVDTALGAAGSAAILGLQRGLELEPGWPPLVIQLHQPNGKIIIDQRATLRRAAMALGLLVLALLLPYAEALTLKSHLANKLAAIKSDLGRLVTIDRELDFLQYLKENEPPYLDALLVLAKAAPPGTHFDTVSMNRRGEVSLRGSLHDGQQVADLRSKLIDSGFFGNVSIDEQAPTPDRQKVNVRMSAQWKPAGGRPTPSVEPGNGAGQPKNMLNQKTKSEPGSAGTSPQAPKTSASRNGKE